MPQSPEPWHLDKRVPVAMILAIVVQTAGAVWWASSINGDVRRLQVQAAEGVVERAADSVRIRALELSSGRSDERMIGIQGSLARIEGLLEDLRP